jgi:hypothetical protein
MKLAASFIIRDIELNDRVRWEPLWRAYSRPIPEEVTEMTWRRFFDGLEPVHALVAEEGGDDRLCSLPLSPFDCTARLRLLSARHVHG